MQKVARVQMAGIPVRIEPTFLVVLVLLGLPQPWPHVVSWVVIASLSVLLHELGHAVAFRAYGLSPSITLHGLGGLTSGSGELTAGRRIVVSLAGPLSALVLVGLPALLLLHGGGFGGDAEVVLRQVVWINVGWSLLNLVPVLPLDGGQVFLDLCDLATRGRGRRAAEVVSVVVAGGLALWALAEGLLFGAVLALGLAALNLGQLRKVRQDELSDRLAAAHRALLDHRPEDADAIVDDVLRQRPQGAVREWAAELRGWARLMAGDRTGVEGSMAEVVATATPSTSLRAAVALAEGRTDEGVAVMAWAFAHDPVGPPKSMGAVAVGGTGTATSVGRELVLLGEDGRAGAVLLRDLLAHVGYGAQAAEVDRVLAIAPPVAGSDGPRNLT
jgi:Zn-dependent protease